MVCSSGEKTKTPVEEYSEPDIGTLAEKKRCDIMETRRKDVVTRLITGRNNEAKCHCRVVHTHACTTVAMRMHD
jgi:hypothetical protein